MSHLFRGLLGRGEKPAPPPTRVEEDDDGAEEGGFSLMPKPRAAALPPSPSSSSSSSSIFRPPPVPPPSTARMPPSSRQRDDHVPTVGMFPHHRAIEESLEREEEEEGPPLDTREEEGEEEEEEEEDEVESRVFPRTARSRVEPYPTPSSSRRAATTSPMRRASGRYTGAGSVVVDSLNEPFENDDPLDVYRDAHPPYGISLQDNEAKLAVDFVRAKSHFITTLRQDPLYQFAVLVVGLGERRMEDVIENWTDLNKDMPTLAAMASATAASSGPRRGFAPTVGEKPLVAPASGGGGGGIANATPFRTPRRRRHRRDEEEEEGEEDEGEERGGGTRTAMANQVISSLMGGGGGASGRGRERTIWDLVEDPNHRDAALEMLSKNRMLNSLSYLTQPETMGNVYYTPAMWAAVEQARMLLEGHCQGFPMGVPVQTYMESDPFRVRFAKLVHLCMVQGAVENPHRNFYDKHQPRNRENIQMLVENIRNTFAYDPRSQSVLPLHATPITARNPSFIASLLAPSSSSFSSSPFSSGSPLGAPGNPYGGYLRTSTGVRLPSY